MDDTPFVDHLKKGFGGDALIAGFQAAQKAQKDGVYKSTLSNQLLRAINAATEDAAEDGLITVLNIIAQGKAIEKTNKAAWDFFTTLASRRIGNTAGWLSGIPGAVAGPIVVSTALFLYGLVSEEDPGGGWPKLLRLFNMDKMLKGFK